MLFFLFLFFNWWIIAIQGCIGFCIQHSAYCWISHTHTHIYMYVYVCSYILFLLSLPPSSHILPLGCGLAQAGLPVPHGSVPLVGCFTHGGACMSVLLSQSIPASPSPAVSTSPFSASKKHSLISLFQTVWWQK